MIYYTSVPKTSRDINLSPAQGPELELVPRGGNFSILNIDTGLFLGFIPFMLFQGINEEYLSNLSGPFKKGNQVHSLALSTQTLNLMYAEKLCCPNRPLASSLQQLMFFFFLNQCLRTSFSYGPYSRKPGEAPGDPPHTYSTLSSPTICNFSK